MIETLQASDRGEVVEVLGLAFSDHPMIPPDSSGRRSRRLVRSILKTFGDAPDSHLFGIRQESQLASVVFVFDAAFEPRGLRLVGFLWQMLRVVGWRMARVFFRVMSAKPVSKERQLELMILGTRTDCQGQGMGRKLVRHVLQFARERGYDSVVLEAAKDTPAHGFYLREGFELLKEIALPTTPLCFLRHPLT